MNRAFAFSAFGYPVIVSWSAIIILAIVSFASAGDGSSMSHIAEGVVWGAVLFLSILVHELGHALVGERLGLRPKGIVLHGFGGLCQYGRRPDSKQGVIASAAGPGAGLLLGALSYGLLRLLSGVAPVGVLMTLEWLVWINLFWSLFNLLPIYPLDGGSILFNGLSLVTPSGKAWKITRVTSVAVAVPVGILGYFAGFVFVPLLAVFLIFENLRP